MTDTLNLVQSHYTANGLTSKIAALLSTMPLGDARPTAKDLAPIDQFHTRGLASTIDLARLARITASDRVLDLGSGLGGPARYLASTYGCKTVGIDLSPDYVEAATYLTERSGLSKLVTMSPGNALQVPAEDASFDVVWMQHVAMNIGKRVELYREAYRLLKQGGRFAFFDAVARDGEPHFPVPWARSAETSFLFTAEQTREALMSVGFSVLEWHDHTALAIEWMQELAATPPVAGRPSLGAVLGSDFQPMIRNLGRNLAEGRVGVLSAVVERPR